MNSNIWNLIRIARRVSQDNPILGYELEQAARAYAADLKPKSFNTEFESAENVLKSLKGNLEELYKRVKDEGLKPDSEEFVQFFDDEAAAEGDKLRGIIKQMKSKSASRVAAEGTEDIKFLDGAEEWLVELDELSKEPSEGGIKKLLEGVNGLISKAPAKNRPMFKADKSESDELINSILKTLNPDTEADVLVDQILADIKNFQTASVLPVLVRIAHAKPEYRPILLPFIKRISSLPIAIQRTASLNALTAIVKRVKRVAS